MLKITFFIVLGVLLLGCFISPASTKKYSLSFGLVKCLGQEDFTGDDDIFIKLFADGIYFKNLTWNDVNTNDNKFFHVASSFNDNFTIQLIELDYLDADDNLGTFVVNSENLRKQKGRIDPWGRGDYQVQWIDWTKSIKELNDKRKNSQETESELQNRLAKSGINEKNLENGLKTIYDYLEDKLSDIAEAAALVYTAFLNNESEEEINAKLHDLSQKVGINPLRGIIENALTGQWPTFVIYAPVPDGLTSFFKNPLTTLVKPLSFDASYGIAIQLDGNDAGLVVDTGFSYTIGLKSNDLITFGLNRNNVPGVGGMTYGYTRKMLTFSAAITYSYDLDLTKIPEFPNLQEVDFNFLLLPAPGIELDVSYTKGISKANGLF